MTGSNGSTISQPTEVELGGRKLLMSPLSDADSARLDEWVRAQFINNARASVPDDLVSTETWDRVVALAMREALGLRWMARPASKLLLATDAGLARLVVASCQRNHPGLTVDEVLALLRDNFRDQLKFQEEFARVNHLTVTRAEGKPATAPVPTTG